MPTKESDAHIISCILYPDSDSWSSSSAIKKIVSAYNETCDICYILHDKDDKEKEKNSQEKKDHYHLFIRFKGYASIDKFKRDFQLTGSTTFSLPDFATTFDLNPAITKEMMDWGGCVRYCCHRTDKSKHKYQYPLSELNANFDITPYFKELTSPESDAVIVKRIMHWAKKNHANIEQVMNYCLKNGTYGQYKRNYRQIIDILSRYSFFYDTSGFEIVSYDDIKE